MKSMHPDLEEINNLYLQVQDYILPPIGQKNQLTGADLDIDKVSNAEASRLYELALGKFREVFPRLSYEDIITGYRLGSEILQRNIAGRMARKFTPEYIPVMQEAIRLGHVHTGPIFLQVLAQHLGSDVEALILETLASPEPSLRETAVYVAGDLQLVTAIPYIQVLLDDKIPEVARAAHKVLKTLNNTS